MVCYPRVDADGGARREDSSCQFCAGGWNYTYQGEAGGGVHPESFFDYGLEVAEVLSLFEGHGVRDPAMFGGGVDFGLQTVVGGWIFEEVVEDG